MQKTPTLQELCLSQGWASESSEQAEAFILQMWGVTLRDNADSSHPIICVQLSGTMVWNTGLVHLKAFNQLECLCVERADVYDNSLSYLRGLGQLRHLTYSRTWITDSGVRYLSELQLLEELDLSANPGVTDASVECLIGLKGLKTLNLSDTGLTPSGIRACEALPEAVVIYDHNETVAVTRGVNDCCGKLGDRASH